MRKLLVTLSLAVVCPLLALAQQAMNNDAVIKLIKAGLSDEVIVSTINASSGTYDISADALIALKTAGASDKIISAIVMKSSGATAAPPTVGTAQPNSQTPAVQEPEVMGKVFLLDSNSHTLKQLPGEQWKRKNQQGFGSAKSTDIVAGEHSSLRVSSKGRIVFIYRPFPDQQTADVLQKIRIYPFDVRHGERTCVVGTMKGGFHGPTNQGNADVVSLEAVKYGISSFALNPPDSHLSPGEYWIFVPGAGGINDPIITFGVD